MSLTLHYHPLSSFCQKVLIALYECGTPFESHLLNLGDEDSSSDFKRLWPMGKMPVLRDEGRAQTIPESSIIIEYLMLHYPGKARLIPADPDLALQTRLRDRFYDHYVMEPMQKIVTDKLRPAGANDPHGVAQAKAMLLTAYGMIEEEMATRSWAVGDPFSMADCAAAPSLFYANLVLPLADAHPAAAAYLKRLMARPSFARVVQEAQPYFALFPG